MKRRTHCEPVSHPVGESLKVIPTLSLIPALLGSPKGLLELNLNNMRPSPLQAGITDSFLTQMCGK